MQYNYPTIIVSEFQLTDISKALGYREQLLQIINSGQDAVVVYFSHATEYDEAYLYALFGQLIEQYGSAWFLNSGIMIDAEDSRLKQEITDYVINCNFANQKNAGSVEAGTVIITQENWQHVPVIRNKAATQEDVADGNAVFFLNTEEFEPTAIDIPLPQCGIYHNEYEERIPVIIVQAEQCGEMQLVGLITLDGNRVVAGLSEIEFVSPEVLFSTSF